MLRQRQALQQWLMCLAAQADFQTAVQRQTVAIQSAVQIAKHAVRRRLIARRLALLLRALRRPVLDRRVLRLRAPHRRVQHQRAPHRRVLRLPAPPLLVKLRPALPLVAPPQGVRLLPDGRMRECGREDTPPSFFRPHSFTCYKGA